MNDKDQIFGSGDLFDKETTAFEPQIRRELDSMDDFEHLGHDSLNQKDTEQISTLVDHHQVTDLLGNSPADDLQKIINSGVEINDEGAAPLVTKHFQDDPFEFEHTAMDNKFPDDIFEKKEKYFDDEFKTNDVFGKPEVKTVTYDFMEAEKGIRDSISNKLIDIEQSKPEVIPKKEEQKDAFSSVENLLSDDFRDVKDEFEQAQSHKREPSPLVAKTPQVPVSQAQEINEIPQPKPVEKKEPPKEVKEKASVAKPVTQSKNVIEAEVFFCKMGLDTWFNPEKLNPNVESLIYWRDPKKSGPVFGGVLLVLLALTYFSFISVIAYLSLLGLTGTISFRVYKNVVQAVQKTGDGHPFKEFLELDLSLPPEKVKEISEVVVAHINAGLSALRRLFLVEDLIDSIKFGVFMWTLTYLGAWFNGMTLVIIAWVALFTLPKVYETNKTQIDANLEIVKSKLAEITSKVKAAVPLGKKEEKKE